MFDKHKTNVDNLGSDSIHFDEYSSSETHDYSSNESDEEFLLSDVEVETLRRAAEERNLPFDKNRTKYSKSELNKYGLVREGYTREELRELGYGPEEVNCFDDAAIKAEQDLAVETPFSDGIRKWQLPIDMMPMRVHKTVFPPNSIVDSHVHPPHSEEAPGGSLRIVVKGSIEYKNNIYKCGDWFFITNGVAYNFVTDPNEETIVFYKYAFFGFEKGNRFSHPHSINN